MLRLDRPRKAILQQISCAFPSAARLFDIPPVANRSGLSYFCASTVNPEGPAPRPNHLLTVYRWPLAVVMVALLGLLAFLAFLWVTKRTYDETLARGGQGGQYAVQKAEAIAEKFMGGNITKTFIAAIPEIASTGAGNLELATSDQTETFRAE